MKQLTTAELLGLGIRAAHSDLKGVARSHFIAALKQDSNNILALLWLASLAPTPADSLHLFQRVLALDPANKHAQAGLHRVRRRLNPSSSEPARAQTSEVFPVQPEPAKTSELSGDDRPTKPLSVNLSPGQMRWLGVEASAGPGQIILEQPTQLLPHLTSTPEYTYLSSEPYQITPVSPFRFVLKILAVIFVIGILGLALGLSAAMFALAEPLIIPSAASRFPIRRDISLPAVVQPSSSSLEIPAVQNITPVEAIVSNASVEPNTEVAFIPPQHIEPAAAPLQTAALTVYPSDSSAAPPLLVGRTLPPEPVPVDPALLAYQPAYPGEKWIEVNVTMQQVTAWEGNLPVMSFKASTGKPDTPTILGQFHVYWKLQKTDMSGFNYYVPDVPYVMFFEGDYALHGTYWHNLFGHPISRGCVNLSIADAKKLFDWAGPAIPPGQTETVAGYDNPGTLIVVHD